MGCHDGASQPGSFVLRKASVLQDDMPDSVPWVVMLGRPNRDPSSFARPQSSRMTCRRVFRALSCSSVPTAILRPSQSIRPPGLHAGGCSECCHAGASQPGSFVLRKASVLQDDMPEGWASEGSRHAN